MSWTKSRRRFSAFYQSGEFEQPRDFNSKNLDDLGSCVCRLALWPDWFTCVVAMETEKKSGGL